MTVAEAYRVWDWAQGCF